MATRNASNHHGNLSSDGNDQFKASSGDGQSAPGGNPPTPKPESPLESLYLEQPLDSYVPSWKVPQTNDELKLFVGQCMDLLKHENAVNPQIKTPMDLADFYESLKIEIHKQKLERAATLEYELTQENIDGFLLSGGEIEDCEDNLIDGIWPKKGLVLVSAIPSFGKTFITFDLIGRLGLNGDSILYCGADETKSSISKKLKALGHVVWPFARLPDGQTLDMAWENIKLWERHTKEHETRFLILDLLHDYAPMNISSPDSIMDALAPIITFANKNNVIVVGIVHTSKHTPNSPVGHMSLVGKSNRLIQLKKTEDPNTVELQISRRGPKKIMRITHSMLDTSSALDLLGEGNNTNGNSGGQTKLEKAIEWIKGHPEYDGISIRLLLETAKHHDKDPLELSLYAWTEARKQLNQSPVGTNT